ncbi:MAG: tetratricopeptide repeat protein [bacterium]|nr:tetratricopeptide repeat protein [bacterium]
MIWETRTKNRICAAVTAAALSVFLLAPASGAPSKEKPEQILLFGLQAFRDRLYEPAADLLRRYLSLWPVGKEAATARYFLGMSLSRSGMRKDAAAAFQEFLRNHGKDSRADKVRFLLGEALEKLGRQQEAAEAYAAVAPGPYRIEAIYRLAALRMALEKWKEAEAALLAFLKGAGADARVPGALYEWAFVLDRMGNAKAETAYRDVLERYPKHPRRRLARRRLGFLLLKKGLYAEAEETFTKLIAAHPGEGRSGRVLIARAEGRYALKKFPLAAMDFEKGLALELPPAERKNAEEGRAAAWWEAKRYPEAVSAYRVLFDRKGAGAEVRIRFLYSLARAGGCTEKERERLRGGLQKIREDVKASAPNGFLLAECLRQAGMTPVAVQEFQGLADRFPGENEGILAALRVAENHERAGKRKEAADWYERAIRAAMGKDRKNPLPHPPEMLKDLRQAALRAAFLRFELGDCGGALRVLRDFPHKTMPEGARAEVAALRGECALRKGDIKQAQLYFGQVLTGRRRSALAAHARFQLAVLAEGKSAKKDAVRNWEETLPLLPAALQREGWLRLGRLHKKTGDLANARKWLLKFAQDKGVDLERRRKTWLLLARDAAALNRWDEAEEALSNWDALKPLVRAEGLHLWTLVRFRAGKCEAAIETAARGHSEQTEDAVRRELLQMHASCLLRLKRFAQALPLLREAIRLSPDDADLRLVLAETLELTGKKKAAELVYEGILALVPGGGDQYRAALRLAALRRDRGDLSAALDAYQVAAQSKRPDVGAAARYETGRLMERQKKRAEALALYEKLAAGPVGASRWGRAARWRAAALYEKNGEWEKALAHYLVLARMGQGAKEASVETAQAAARAQELQSYLESVRRRVERIKKLEPALR